MRRNIPLTLWKSSGSVVSPNRQAKQNPWWERVKFTAAVVGGALGVTGALYGGRRIYFHYRGDGNILWVEETVRDYMREHPKLAVAVLHMSAHHALSGTTTPFGAPMVVPPELQDEAEEVLAFLKTIQKQQPAVSVADLWVLASGYSLSGLGGPMSKLRWGNRSASEDELEVAPAAFSEELSEVVQLKKLLANQGYPLQEIAALMGYRTIGHHADQRGLSTTPSGIPIKRKCTTDELVFDNGYFINLLEKTWQPNQIQLSGSKMFGLQKGETITVYTCPAEEMDELAVEGGAGTAAEGKLTEEEDKIRNQISMRPVDLCLLQDPLIKGWLIKYSENEIKFFYNFMAVLDRLHLKGYVASDVV